MAESNRDRIIPSLLDRLTDEGPGAPGRGVSVTVSELRRSVLRDLTWLFNTTRPFAPDAIEAQPQVRNSVLNYGLPALSGLTASGLDIRQLERALRQAIVDFEPRILPATLRVKAIEQTYLEHHNVIGVEISGQLWAQPVPLELLVRTEIDLETGRVEIAELTASRTR
jgi:type VI secretion system protein ImpF